MRAHSHIHTPSLMYVTVYNRVPVKSTRNATFISILLRSARFYFFVNNSTAIFIGHISYAICWTLVFRGQERGNGL